MYTSDKRQLIMQAAEKLFANRRIHEITLDEVAQTARIGKGTIYRYFEDKDDLFFQVATSGFDELCELIETRVPAEASFEEQLLQTGIEIGAFFEKRREMFQMMLAQDARMPGCKVNLRERWFKQRKKLVRAVGAVIAHGVKDVSVRDDVPLEVLATFFLGMLRARAQDLREGPEEWRRFELVIDLFCNGISAGSVSAVHSVKA